MTDPRFYDPTPLDPEARAAIRRILEGGAETPEAPEDDSAPRDTVPPPRPEPSTAARTAYPPAEWPTWPGAGGSAHRHG